MPFEALDPEIRVGQVRDLADELSPMLGDRLSLARPVREQHGCTVTWHENQPPDLVVFPRSTEEVVAVVRACAKRGLPMIPYGTGTSLEGGVNAPHGGVCIDTTMMNQIIQVDALDFKAEVQPGVTRMQLNRDLRDTGLFFSVDPGADASLGGMASTRASGTTAVRYGTMRENVVCMEVVLADGSVVQTGRKVNKSSTGYDLTRLFVGAEGTLGIVTSVTVKLHGIPESVSTLVCAFPSVKAACDAAITAIQSNLTIARVELLDEVQIRGCNLHSRLGLPELPTLFIEFNGTPASTSEQMEMFEAIAQEYGCSSIEAARTADDRARLWRARHESYEGQLALRPGAKTFATDICVPISRLAECVDAVKEEVRRRNMICPILGHIGDGNFHAAPLVMMDDPAEVANVTDFARSVVELALGLGGTCSGEHGIGQGKRAYMTAEHGAAGVAVMRSIKESLDPRGLMNPGKVLPDPA